VLLRAPVAALDTFEKELAMMREIERSKTEKIFKQARIFKTIAVILAFIVLVWVGWWLFRLLPIFSQQR
jgi:flagellar biogenesis protein FliO